VRADLAGVTERMDRLERRQTEADLRIATELVAIAGAVRETRDAYVSSVCLTLSGTRSTAPAPPDPTASAPSSPGPSSPPRAKAIEHPRDAIEHLLACLDLVRCHVAPGDRHAQRRATLGVGPYCGREPCDTMPALAAVAFGDVQRDRAERRSKLLAEVSVLAPDARHIRTKNLDGADRQIKDVES
jgi:hypothetical protein